MAAAPLCRQLEGSGRMTEAPQKNPELNALVKKLMSKTGISELQAIELIALLGAHWPSLIREARILESRP